jgi:hypothetical protein
LRVNDPSAFLYSSAVAVVADATSVLVAALNPSTGAGAR